MICTAWHLRRSASSVVNSVMALWREYVMADNKWGGFITDKYWFSVGKGSYKVDVLMI